MLKAIWNDLDPDIKKSNDCRGGYQVICADLKRKAEAEAKS